VSGGSDGSLETIAQGVGERLDVLDATRARRLIEARLFPKGARPPSIGRFELRDMLGAGGMGVVYAAHDPDLGRDVAIKMLRPTGDAGTPEHLGREARALARVSHPNVVTIFEVGTDAGQLFFVMELVRGRTLGEWCAAQRARVDAGAYAGLVLRAFAEAGHGLAAVHDAQLVHLDFKPSNVLVGDDERVRVTDFGIVRIADARVQEIDATEARSAGGGATTRTRLGGTPAYMSPEQLMGTVVDRRSDVFSYCVSLFECLVGTNPYPARTIAEKVARFAAGDAVVPRVRGVPRRVAAALERGLKVDAAARWPSMTPLLEALAPRTRTGPLVAGALGLAIGGAVLGSVLGERADARPCEQAPALVAEAWSPARAAAIRDRFVDSGLPYAEQAALTVAGRMQAYADEWVAAHTDACTATRVHGHQSDAVLAQRMECLDERRVELGALATALESADARTIEDATHAPGSLSPVATCADVAALARIDPLPADPGLRARADALRKALAEGRGQRAAGDYGGALHSARANLDAARQLGHEPLLLAALVDSASSHLDLHQIDASEAAVREALPLLGRVRDDLREAALWRVMVLVYAERGDSRRAAELLPILDVSAARTNELAQVARGHRVAAGVLTEVGDLIGAQARIEVGQAALVDAPDPVQFAGLLHAAARLAQRRGELARARELDAHHVLLELALVGPHHPTVAGAMANLAIQEAVLGHPDRALALFEHVQAIIEPLYPADAVEMGRHHNNVANVLERAGRLVEARDRLRLAVSIISRRLGERDVGSTTCRLNLARLERLTGDVDAAEQLALAVLKNVDAVHGRISPRTAAVLEELGAIDAARGRWSAAEERWHEALRIREATSSNEIDEALLGLARVDAALDRPAKARERLERVVQRSIEMGEPWRGHRLSAEIALASLEIAAGERLAGAARLETVRVRARNLGRESYEREATAALAAVPRR
jgi:tetratricopeptide (TPR) repeat protein